MGKAGVFGAAAVVVVAGAYIGAAAYSGGAVQKQYNAAFDKMEQTLPFIKVVDRKFDKGLFSSAASYGVRIGCDPQEGGGGIPSVTITFRDSIAHGPLPGFAGAGLARIDTQIVLPPDAPEGLRKWIAGMKPDAIRTTIAFDGATATSVNLPAGETKDDEVHLHWQPVRVSAHMNGARTYLNYDMDVPEVAFGFVKDGGSADFKLVNLRAQAGGELTENMLMSDGSGTATIDQMQMAVSKINLLIELNQINYTASQKTENDLLGATASLTGVLDVKAGEKEFKFDKIELQESMKRIHAPTLQKIVLGFWGEMGNICRKTPEELAQSLQGQQAEMLLGLKDLLAHDPEYSVDKIALTWEGKEGQVSYSVAAHGITAEELQQTDPAQLMGLMNKLTIKSSARVPQAWLEKIAAETKGNSPQEAHAQIENILAPLVQAGYVTREGDYVSSSAVMKHGQTTINGKPFDPHALAGGVPPSHAQPEQGGEKEKDED